MNKYKARLVVKEYTQVFRVEFSETFALVARLDTIRLLLVVAEKKNWKVFQLDAKSSFLNGYLKEEIFVEQPDGFVVQGKEDKVCLLKKALYGLKKAPRAWYSRIDDHLINLGFHKSLNEATLYVRSEGINIIIISIYVDDLLVTGNNQELINEFKSEMFKQFEMTDLGLLTYFLGLEVRHLRNQFFISQRKCANEILKKFHIESCKPVETPMKTKEKFSKDDGSPKVAKNIYRSLIGCLMYLTASRPNIVQAVSLLSRFMHCASEEHMQATKRILRYVKGTIDYGIKYAKTDQF